MVAPLVPDGDRVQMRVLIDTSSIEVWAMDGEVVLTSRVFPTGGDRSLQVFAEGENPENIRISLIRHGLKSIWK